MKRMYEVFYDGENIGVVAAAPAMIALKAKIFAKNSGQKKFDAKKVSWSDKNHDKYKHWLKENVK